MFLFRHTCKNPYFSSFCSLQSSQSFVYAAFPSLSPHAQSPLKPLCSMSPLTTAVTLWPELLRNCCAVWLDSRGRGVGGEEGFSSGSYMADILLFKDKVRSVISGLEEDEFRAGRSRRILGGCQQQQHNRMTEKNEGWYINRRVFTSQSVWQWAHTGEMVFSRPRKHSYLR